jgi:3-oxoacyl-[acyl-carrier protein] reductase
MGSLLDLKGRIVLVTGAGQGVGRQIALHCIDHNAGGVIVNDFHLQRAEVVAQEIESRGGKALAIAADVSKYDAVKEMVVKGNERFGRIDVLVNNAGNFGAERKKEAIRETFWESEPSDWEHWLGVNLYGVLHCCRSVVPGMIEHKQGRIVTIISDAGRVGEASMEVYSAAKAGAAGLTRSLARSLGRYQITVNAISIAATVTPDSEKRLSDPELLKRMMANYVIRRPGQPTDIANMALFLASDAGAWITGQVYPVNGGFSFAQ